MEQKHIFADGLRVEEKEIKPDFKIIKLGIKAEEFMNFLAKYTNDKGYVNVDVKQSKNGKYYAELNTYGLDLSKTETPIEDEEIPF